MPKEERIAADIERSKVQKEKARDLTKKKNHLTKKKRAVSHIVFPWRRRLSRGIAVIQITLHDRVSDVFAELMVADLQFLKFEQLRKISLAAKWCPSLYSSFDRTVFPRDSYPEYEGIEEAYYAYQTRDRLRKEYLVPLRKALELPEVYMCANLWNTLPYNCVASVALKTCKEQFQKHDKERFEEYLSSVQSPHNRNLTDLSKKGMLRNYIAVYDVSGSMEGTPMEVCVALGLLISELSAEPWKRKVITFSKNPQLHMIQGDDLRSKTQFIREMDWGMNTNFQKVFDHILQVAMEGKLKEEQMIKRFLTDYEAIQRKFKESEYTMVPEIVFWNLMDSKATPVPSNQSGVALVSGFSKNLVTLFLVGDGVLSPNAVLELAISGEEFQKLVILD
ncbi:hypothetical protein NE237_024666 [Protea cynaroides]|uniref:Uncharacterized protein n=1 Tax=Protea cynaroides TaxID=273540 RepID=A0A9Q0H1K8_9MAGN|nr:hypothetical protein NE237_024666 [Protea cynaroides]